MTSSPDTKTLKLAIVGLGHWGPNLLRTFYQDPKVQVSMICDRDQNRLSQVASHYPNIETTPHIEGVLFEDEIDAVVISTPTNTHYTLTRRCLEGGKHVLVEKPLAQTSQECVELIQIAERYKRKLMVGHVFMYNAAIQYVQKLIQREDLGEIIYIYATRVNLGPVRKDVDALWDLAPHDISIFNSWLGSEPISASARGMKYLNPTLHDVVFASLKYPGDILVNLHVSWLDPRKIRQIVVVGTKKMVLFDDLDSFGAVHVYDKTVTTSPDHKALLDSIQDYKVIIQEGDLNIPKVPRVEPLKNECQHFIDWILEDRQPLSKGIDGLQVVQALESLTESLDNNGIEVPLPLASHLEDPKRPPMTV